MPVEGETLEGAAAAFRLSDWLVQPSLNRISNDEISVRLELKVMDVLVCLAERAGEVVTRQEIIDRVWSTEYIADNTLTHAIAEIRTALGDDARDPHYIETIPRRGYRLVAEVTPAELEPGDEGTKPERSRSILRPAAWVAAFGLLGLVLGSALIAWRQPSATPPALELNPHRIAVVPFADRTGDPSLHSLVALTSDRLTQSLAELDELEVAPATVVRASSAGVDSAQVPHAVAAATLAGLVVTGVWDAVGDGFELQTTLEDTVNHAIVRAFEPIPATRVAPEEAVRILRDWTLMAVQDHLHPGLAFGAGDHYPEYEAYRRYRQWFEFMGVGNTTLEEVIELDPDWVRVRIVGSLALFFVDSHAYAETLLEPIEVDERLNEHQVWIVRGLRNGLDGHWVDAYVEFNAALEHGHDNYITRMALLAFAKAANRPGRVLEHFEQLGEPPLAVAADDFSHRFAIEACHMLGRYEQELELAQRLGRYSRTAWFGEARALVALGRLDEIEALISEALLNHPATAGELILRVARFLQGHGYHEEGMAMAERAAEWWSNSSLQDKEGEDCRVCIAESLEIAGHAAEAQAIYRELALVDPLRIGWLEGVGVTAAQLGDRDTAEEMMARIEATDTLEAIPRRKFAARARIAAALCDRDEALKLLRDAIDNGFARWIWLHQGFGCLTDDPEFQELLRPKG